MHVRINRFDGRSSGLVKWKLETIKHFFNRHSTGALQFCAPVCCPTLQPKLGLCLQKFSSGGFLLENDQSNLPSTPNWTKRDLIKHQRRSWPLFDFANKQFMIICIAILFFLGF